VGYFRIAGGRREKGGDEGARRGGVNLEVRLSKKKRIKNRDSWDRREKTLPSKNREGGESRSLKKERIHHTCPGKGTGQERGTKRKK